MQISQPLLTCQNDSGSVSAASSVAGYVPSSCSIVCTPLTCCVMFIVGRLKRNVSKRDWATPCRRGAWGGGGGPGGVEGLWAFQASVSYNPPSVKNQYTRSQVVTMKFKQQTMSKAVWHAKAHSSSLQCSKIHMNQIFGFTTTDIK